MKYIIVGFIVLIILVTFFDGINILIRLGVPAILILILYLLFKKK